MKKFCTDFAGDAFAQPILRTYSKQDLAILEFFATLKIDVQLLG